LPDIPPAHQTKKQSPYDEDGLPRVVTGKAHAQRPGTARTAYFRPDDQDDDGRSVFKIILITVFGLLVLAGAAVAALMIVMPVDLVRDRIAQEFKAKTGRDLVIAGATSFSLYPDVTVALNKVAVSPPPGMQGGPTIDVEAIEASVKFWPLLSREIVVDSLRLRRPVIDLRIDAQGRRSWDFSQSETLPWPRDRVRYAQAGTSTPKELRDFASGANRNAAERRLPSSQLQNLALSDVRLIDGLLRYTDERTDLVEEVTLEDLNVGLSSVASPLTAQGSIVWRGETLNFAGKFAPFSAMIDDQPARVVLSAMGRVVDAAFDGTALLAKTPSIEGRLTAKARSVAELSTWLGKPMVGGSADGPLDMAARVKAATGEIALTETRLGFEKTTATGTLTVDTRGPRPHLKGVIRLTELDLDRLAAIKPGQPRATAPSGRLPEGGSAGASKNAPQSIEDLLKEPSPSTTPPRPPQVRGYSRQTGWSSEPLDFSGMGLFDADLNIGFTTVAWHAFKTANGQFQLALKDRKARITIEQVQLYSGTARGILTIDATNPTTIIGANITADAVSTLPFLKDTANFDWLSGKGRVHVALGAQGRSERQLIQTLNGKADIAVANGALIGFNITEMIRNATQGRLSSLQRNVAEKTDFSEMAASFQIAGGTAQNQDLRISSPLLRLTGAGAVNLAGGLVDYTARPRLLTTAAAPAAGSPPQTGIEIPVRLQGPWENPEIKPDISSVLRDPNQVIEAAKEIGKNMRGSEVEKAVKGLLSGDSEQSKKAKDLLNQFLKR
jgi:AsmA protein